MKTLLKALLLVCLSTTAFAVNDKCVRLDDIPITVSGTPANIPNECFGGSGVVGYEITGGPATMSTVYAGCSRATNICTTLNTSTATTSSTVKPAIDAIYDYFTVTPTWTGGTNVKVVVHSTITTALPTGAGGANVTVVGPLDGADIRVHCEAGCAGGNANGQATMANSAPVVIASDQSAVPTNMTKYGGGTLGAMANYGTSPGAVLVPGINAFITNIPHVIVDTAPSTAVTNAGLSNIDVLLSTRTKPADQQHAILDSGTTTVTQATGTNLHAVIDSGSVTTTPPSNASTNVAQFGGTNVSTGTGASGAGVPRVTLANDSSLAANQSVNVNQLGGAAIVSDPCNQLVHQYVPISSTASVKIVTGTAAKQTYLCFLQLSTAGAVNVALVEGTGSTCGTGTAGMAGGATAATGWNFVGAGSETAGSLERAGFKTATLADDVCLLLSAVVQTSGVLQYVQQ